MKAQQEIFSTADAATYPGVSKDTIKRYMYDFDPPKLVADFRIGRELAFKRSTLDLFERSVLRPEGYTVEEAAAYLGVNVSWIRYHMQISGKLAADAMSGKNYIFKRSTLDAVRDLASAAHPQTTR